MVIVTGATGFIGSALIWEFNQAGENEIIAVDEFGHGQKWKNLVKRNFSHFVQKDQLFEFLAQPDVADAVDGVFHMGACSSTTETDMDFLLETNFYYSQALYEWCTVNEKPFIYASSCATYGDGEKGFSDQTPAQELVPLNGYGYSKVLFDRWVERQTERPPQVVGLKFSNVFGPQEYHKGEQASVAFKAFEQIQQSGRLKLFKSHRSDYQDGMQKRDFVYIKDVTRWILEIFDNEIASGIYNMGMGISHTWLDLADAIFKSLGKEKAIDWIDIPIAIRNQYQYYTEAKMGRLIELGLSKSEWTLDLAIRDYVGNYLSQRDRFL